MTKRHPANDWEWEDYAEESFQEWFNDLYGDFSLRAEWFYGDCEIGDEKQRKDILVKWLHSAYTSGYNMGRLHETKVGLTE
jgi:hypothetical protein